MKNLTTQEVTVFAYNEWLSTQWGDNLTLEWEIPAVIDDEQMMDYTEYTIQVKTSDVGGMFNICCIQFYKKPVSFPCCDRITTVTNPLCLSTEIILKEILVGFLKLR